MSSHSVSDYRKLCTEIIEHAIQYPRIYYETLLEFQLYMRGHAIAFDQLEIIKWDDSFHSCFTEWLCEKTDSSGASGWAYVITELAEARGVDAEPLFFEYVREFLDQWGKEEQKE